MRNAGETGKVSIVTPQAQNQLIVKALKEIPPSLQCPEKEKGKSTEPGSFLETTLHIQIWLQSHVFTEPLSWILGGNSAASLN